MARLLDKRSHDREWNAGANAYARHGLVSGLTVLDAEDSYTKAWILAYAGMTI